MVFSKATPSARASQPIFKLKQGSELLTDHSGLSLVGFALNQFAKVRQGFDTVILKRSGLSVGEIVTAYIGLLCTGKSDFVAIENHRNDCFFADALGISDSLAASTLRIQLDIRTKQIIPLSEHLSVNLLKAVNASISPMVCGLVACDIDVFSQDNSRTKKDTYKQLHSEFKTDLDLERLPSGKFDTNDCVLSLAGMAYNVLRLIGQLALLGEDAPMRHTAKRRRLKAVIQEMICVSAKIVTHARSVILNFGHHCLAIEVFERLYGQWSTA